MPRYKVRDGATLSHHGAVLEGGATVDLPRRLGAEFPHLLDEIDANGAVVAPVPAWQDSLASAQSHERITLLEQGRARVQAQLAEAQARLDQAEQATALMRAEVSQHQQTLADIAAALEKIAAPAPVDESSSEPKAARKRAVAIADPVKE